MIVRELITALGFDIDDRKLKDFDNSVEQAKAGLVGLTAAVVTTGVALFGMVKSASNAADNISKISKAAGVSVEDLQRLGFVAEISGASLEELGVGLKFLSKNMLEASKNADSDMAKQFVKLGIRVKEANGELRSSAEVIAEISDKFAGMTNPTEKAALAMKLFGRSGGNLIGFLERGSGKLAQLSAEFEAFGGVMDEQTLEGLKDFNDALAVAGAFIGALKNQIAVGLAPVLIEMLTEFKDFLVVNKEIIKHNLTAFVRGLADYFGILWRISLRLAEGFMFLAKHMGGVEKLTKYLLIGFTLLTAGVTVAGIYSMAKAFFTLAKAMGITALAPAGIAAGLLAIFLVVEDIAAYFQGKKSITGIIVKKFDETWADVKANFIKFKNWFLADWMNMVQFIDDASKAINPVDDVLGLFGVGKAFTPADLYRKYMNNGGNSGSDNYPGMIQQFARTPSNSPLPGPAGTSGNVTVQATTTVTVPPATPPGLVGEKVESGIEKGTESWWRRAGQVLSPQTGY